MFFKKKEPKKPVEINPQAVEQKIRDFVASKTTVIKPEEIMPDTKLFSSGILDSLAFIQLVVMIETEFKLQLSGAAEVSLDTMDSIQSILQTVQKAAGGQ